MKMINYLMVVLLFSLSLAAALKPKAQATVFGGTDTAKIFLNDLTLWSGEPVDHCMNKDAYKNLSDIRMNGEIN
ncbi:MAG: hypothetical protein HQ448_04480 [Cytophagales bacterium]|nr:hypothetical protein [Cytophagales bacterium]